jgi:SNF2 family DNA or RNA helicase
MYRIGQKKNVWIVKLHIGNSVEDRIVHQQRDKIEMVASMLGDKELSNYVPPVSTLNEWERKKYFIYGQQPIA